MSDEKATHITVDRGQPVIVVCTFGEGDPDVVNFSFTQPKSERPHVDDGFGQAKSCIVKLEPGVYRYVIPTKGFQAGEGTWHFSGEWITPVPDGYDESSIFGTYQVNPAPKQLL